jgi:hypothetical protein
MVAKTHACHQNKEKQAIVLSAFVPPPQKGNHQNHQKGVKAVNFGACRLIPENRYKSQSKTSAKRGDPGMSYPQQE